MLPEMEALSAANTVDAMSHIVRLVLELLCIDDAKEIGNWASSSVIYWHRERSQWKDSFEKRVEQLVQHNHFFPELFSDVRWADR